MADSDIKLSDTERVRANRPLADHNFFANLIWQIADLLRGPYRPPQYERVMLPMTVLRRFDCVLAPSKAKVLAEHERSKDRFEGEALDARLNRAASQRFHNHSPLDFESLKPIRGMASASLMARPFLPIRGMAFASLTARPFLPIRGMASHGPTVPRP